MATHLSSVIYSTLLVQSTESHLENLISTPQAIILCYSTIIIYLVHHDGFLKPTHRQPIYTVFQQKKCPTFIFWITQSKSSDMNDYWYTNPEDISCKWLLTCPPQWKNVTTKYVFCTFWSADLMHLIKSPLLSSKKGCILNTQLLYHMTIKISHKQNCRNC